MIDFGKTVNIIFAAACGALFAFLLASTIAVAAKGKRKCSAFDVILRIVSSLCLAASAALLACATLTMLKLSVRIDVSDAPVFVAGGSETALPLPDLFVTLSDWLGTAIVAALLAVSLAALIADCRIANKKDGDRENSEAQKLKAAKSRAKQGKSKQPAKPQTPEQARRAAELEKIRRLADSAVKKTNAAASHADVAVKPAEGDRAVAQSDELKPNEPVVAPVADDIAAQDQAQAPTAADEQGDWRTETPQPQQHSEFIGITENADPDFDSFDTFDDVPDAENADGDFIEQDAPQADADELFDYDSAEAQDDEQDAFDDAADDEVRYDAPGEYADDIEADIADEAIDDEAEEFDEIDDELWEAEKAERAEKAEMEERADADERYDDAYAADETDETETADAQDGDEYAQTEEQADLGGSGAYAADGYGDIEPNRDIYIPKVRTIVRNRPTERNTPSAAETPKRGATGNTGKTGKTGKKRGAAVGKAVDGNADKGAATKSTAADSAVGKRNTAKRGAQSSAAKNQSASKSSGGRGRPKAAKPATATATANAKPAPSKKLPVPRRYVIIDRKSAVNVFSEYLKERDAAEKSKLEASINKIIIK
ncbi:MAG: hypothetical protein NC184_06640 [Roseburia sp.]|nr:hypothetical protein [Roseburia sp.]